MPNIRVKIDVTKIDKSALFSGKNGAKYLDLFLREDPNGEDQYGNNFMVVQDLPRERRDKGERGAILGNGKFIGGASPQPRQQSQPQQNKGQQWVEDDDMDQIPF